MTRQEAIQLAEEYGLEEGVARWRVRQCGYDWCIENTLHTRSDGARGGKILTIDGRTGKVLETIFWDDTP